MPSASAVLVTLVDAYEVAVAGLGALLGPHEADVRLVPVEDAVAGRVELDVLLVEPVGLSRDQHDLTRRLAAQHGVSPVVYSWRAPTGAALVGGAGHLSKRLPAAGLAERLVDLAGLRGAAAPVVRAADLRPGDGLTPREVEVLGLIAQGLSNQEICGRLYISINSLKTYIRTAYRKIGVERRSQAVLWAVAHGVDVDASDVAG